MATLDWELANAGDVTLVHAAVRSEVEQSVRIVNELAGPVWPPRSQGRPTVGWTDGSYAGVIEPGSPLVVGYASPAPPAEPPVSLETAPPPDDGLAEPTPSAVVRALGTAAPPRAAVPQIASDGSIARYGSHPRADGECVGPDEVRPDAAVQSSATNARGGGPPAAVTAWLDDVAASAQRGGTGEDGTGEGFDANLATDHRAVAVVRKRCETVLERIEGLADPKWPERER